MYSDRAAGTTFRRRTLSISLLTIWIFARLDDQTFRGTFSLKRPPHMPSTRNRVLYGYLVVFLIQMIVAAFSSSVATAKSDIADESVDVSQSRGIPKYPD